MGDKAKRKIWRLARVTKSGVCRGFTLVTSLYNCQKIGVWISDTKCQCSANLTQDDTRCNQRSKVTKCSHAVLKGNKKELRKTVNISRFKGSNVCVNVILLFFPNRVTVYAEQVLTAYTCKIHQMSFGVRESES